MAILNGIIKKLNGSAGQLTFKQVNGQTIVSEKVTSVKNARTSAQQKHRMKWANMVQMYKGISPLLLSGFENKSQGVSDYNMFMKVNINVSPVYLSKQDVNAGACIAAPYQLTQGTLPSIVISGSGGTRKTDINIGSLVITASTKVKEFANAVVQNNADYEYGDQIAFFLVKQLINQATLVPYCQFSAWSVILDKDSEVKLWDQVYQYGFSADGNVLAHGSTNSEGDAVYCWVHSRNENGKTKVSTQYLLDNNSKLADYTSSDAYKSAVETYGGESDVFLRPDGVSAGVNGNSAGANGGGASGTPGAGGGDDDEVTI